jgi:tRNA(Glu) U13 pseudouridine synthase TruD
MLKRNFVDFMKYELNKNTFFVNEVFSPKLIKLGYYNYYIIKKRDLSHKQLLKRLPKDSLFCGIKDKNATTTQWICTKSDIEEIDEENLKITYKGQSNEKIWIGKHKENSFKVVIKINKKEKVKLLGLKKELAGNYFGEQRFDVRVEPFYDLIKKGKYEEALKYFLTKKSKYDSDKSAEIKKLIIDNWGDWEKIYENEILPQAKKELFYFLEKDNNFCKAFGYVEPKSFRQMLKAIQAKKFNSELTKIMIEKKCKGLRATKALTRKLVIVPDKFEKENGLKRMERKTFFMAKKIKVKPTKDNLNTEISFSLPTGCYATIYLKFLKEQLNN